MVADARAIGWTSGPFETPQDVGKAWEKALAASSHAAEFNRAIAGDLPARWEERIDAHIAKMAATGKADAPARLPARLWPNWSRPFPEMIGGSADLTGSNNTIVKGMTPFDAPNYDGRYVHYGVREFGMAAALNGMALHGGVIPFRRLPGVQRLQSRSQGHDLGVWRRSVHRHEGA